MLRARDPSVCPRLRRPHAAVASVKKWVDKMQPLCQRLIPVERSCFPSCKQQAGCGPSPDCRAKEYWTSSKRNNVRTEGKHTRQGPWRMRFSEEDPGTPPEICPTFERVGDQIIRWSPPLRAFRMRTPTTRASSLLTTVRPKGQS